LAASERCIAALKLLHLRFLTQNSAAPFNTQTDGTQQRFIAEWLRQEFHSSRLHRLDRLGDVNVARNEDNRKIGALARDAFLKLKTTEARKREIQNQAARNRRARMRKK